MNETLLENEFKTLAILPIPGVLVRVRDRDFSEWHCTALGDDFSPFKGALFYFTVKFLERDNSGLPIITVFTPNAFMQANLPYNDLWDIQNWRSDPHARSVVNRIKNMLSGIGLAATELSEANQKAIAIRSSVYTKLNPKWLEIFPDMNTEQGEWTLEEIATLQSSPSSPDLNSSGFSAALSASSSSSSSTVSISPSKPTSEKFTFLPAATNSPTKLSSSSPTQAGAMLQSQLKPSTSPTPPTTTQASSSGTLSSSDGPPAAASSSSGQGSLRIPVSPRQQPSSSPKKTLDASIKSSSETRLDLVHFNSEEGVIEIYTTIFTHLKATVPGWVSQDNAQKEAERLPTRGLPDSVEHLTHESNPSLTILEVYLHDLGAEEGVDTSGDRKQGVWCKMRADFGTWHKIRTNTADWSGLDSNMPEGEAQREHARQLIVQVLDSATHVAWNKLRVRLTFSDIDLAGTEGSMRAVFQGIGPSGSIFARETEVMRLNLSSTRTSPRSLLSLHKLCNLQELLLDHCPSIQKSGKNVFSLLLKKDSIPSLTSLSVVGTSQVMSVSWIAEVEQRCPNLKKLYFTRQPGVKALGWSDNVLMQTMRDPLLLPCGHIGDRASLLSLGYCAFDRQAFRVSELASLNPNITLLEKDPDGKWNATIVDAARKPLDAKVIYHRQCGSFFNLATLKEIYDLHETEEISKDTVDEIRAQSCHYCKRQFGNNTRICFPHSAEPSEKHAFNNLQDVSNYGALTLSPSSSSQ